MNYPTTFQEIPRWAQANHVPVSEAKVRFVQGLILQAITRSRELQEVLVFKGGNALDLIWHRNRSTEDLDFSSISNTITDAQLQTRLGDALGAIGRLHGASFRIHSVKRQPPGPEKTFVTFLVKVGYALQDDAANRKRIEDQAASKAVVPVEISLNEPICGFQTVQVGEKAQLKVSTLEDIVAEKLRALLQQRLRNRTRRQDVLDIAVLLKEGRDLELAQISEFLKKKAAARDVPVTRAAFREPTIRKNAEQDYAELEATTSELFISFEEAFASVLRLVDALDLPE